MDRRRFLKSTGARLACVGINGLARATTRQPNFIVVLWDDLGYGDIRATVGGSFRLQTSIEWREKARY
jgi:hypothetical protein